MLGWSLGLAPFENLQIILDATRLGLVEVRGEELRSVRCEFDERCFIDGTWGYPNGRSMVLNCYKSEHAERQQMDVDCFDGFCCECARRLKDRIGELPEDLPKTGNCPWKTGRSARCDASCVKKCMMLWALRHRREIEGWRKYKPIRVWDEMNRKAYETELKKRNLAEGDD